MVQNWNLNFCTGLKIHEQKSDGHVEKTHEQMINAFGFLDFHRNHHNYPAAV